MNSIIDTVGAVDIKSLYFILFGNKVDYVDTLGRGVLIDDVNRFMRSKDNIEVSYVEGACLKAEYNSSLKSLYRAVVDKIAILRRNHSATYGDRYVLVSFYFNFSLSVCHRCCIDF